MKKERRVKKFGSKALSIFLILIICLWTCLPVSAKTESVDKHMADKVDLSFDCKSAILMEASTGTILYEQNPDEALPPASVTKIMTLLLVMEAIEEGKIKYTDTVRASANACSMGGSQIYLEENEEMSVEDLLKSVVIASANDAAVALAEHIAGTEEAFVDMMNEKARLLNMENTSFENTNGLDDTVQAHLTSARDIAIMSRELIRYPKIIEYSSIWMDSIRNGEFGLTNTNRLVRFYKGATGLKTGSTSKAGFCISATAERNGMTLIAVIMGSPTRDIRNSAAVSLLDYGFANYSLYTNKGQSINNIPVVKGIQPYLKAEYSDFYCVINKKGSVKITVEPMLPEKITAPVTKGDVIGEVVYKMGENEIGRLSVIASENIEGLSFWRMFKEFFKKFANIF